MYDILEQDFHIIPSLSKEKIEAILANAVIAQRLKIKKGKPVLMRERFVYDPGGRPIEYNIGLYNAEKNTYSIDIERKD